MAHFRQLLRECKELQEFLKPAEAGVINTNRPELTLTEPHESNKANCER
jgi:hypothetical protein